jgi:hypothetical protein
LAADFAAVFFKVGFFAVALAVDFFAADSGTGSIACTMDASLAG